MFHGQNMFFIAANCMAVISVIHIYFTIWQVYLIKLADWRPSKTFYPLLRFYIVAAGTEPTQGVAIARNLLGCDGTDWLPTDDAWPMRSGPLRWSFEIVFCVDAKWFTFTVWPPLVYYVFLKGFEAPTSLPGCLTRVLLFGWLFVRVGASIAQPEGRCSCKSFTNLIKSQDWIKTLGSGWFINPPLKSIHSWICWSKPTKIASDSFLGLWVLMVHP